MTSAETRALRRAALLVLSLGLVRATVERVRAPALMEAVDSASSRKRASLLEESSERRDEQARRGRPLSPGERIDPNVAPESELDRLPGVGPATARRIVEARKGRGGFTRPEDLLAVPGIGPRGLERMAPYLHWPQGGSERVRRPAGQRGRMKPPLVRLNRADSRELQRLPGVGPALARRILELRESLGRFRSVEDLLGVRGIGPTTLKRLTPFVVLDG